jgi:hypothetical protein
MIKLFVNDGYKICFKMLFMITPSATVINHIHSILIKRKRTVISTLYIQSIIHVMVKGRLFIQFYQSSVIVV